MPQNTNDRIAIASMRDVEDGKRIWFPPNGDRPYWAHLPRARDLTDAELQKYGLDPEDYK